MENIIYPDYNNSALNTVSSILKYYNVHTVHKTNEYLDETLAKTYKNVVFMIFDGMGIDMLEKNLKEDSYFRKNIKQKVTSVYPCTTTAAMTTYVSGLSPLEHGWLGWSLYFKEFDRCIDLFSNFDSATQISAGKTHAAITLMNNDTIFNKIDKATEGKIKSYSIYPEGFNFPNYPNTHITVKETETMMKKIESLCRTNDEKFIMCYWPEPDHTMHVTGCYTSETRKILENINKKIELLSSSLSDTLIIISADHGLVNINETIYINENQEIYDALIMPPSIEPRGTTFFVKKHMINKFPEIFNKYYKDDFILLTREQALNKNIFGFGNQHKKVDDFLGDFFACATSDKIFKCKKINSTDDMIFKAHHAGITDKEMMVPIIVIEKK